MDCRIRSGKGQFLSIVYGAQSLVKRIPSDIKVLSQTDLPGSAGIEQFFCPSGSAGRIPPVVHIQALAVVGQ